MSVEGIAGLAIALAVVLVPRLTKLRFGSADD